MALVSNDTSISGEHWKGAFQKRIGGPGGHQAGHEPAKTPSSIGGHCQQAEQGDLSPLLSAAETRL